MDNEKSPVLKEAMIVLSQARQLLKNDPEKALQLFSKAAKDFGEASNYFRESGDMKKLVKCLSMKHHCISRAMILLYLIKYAPEERNYLQHTMRMQIVNR